MATSVQPWASKTLMESSKVPTYDVKSKWIRRVREVVRLMQLRFLGSFRWNSGASTQHFEMLDSIDIGRVKMLECRHFVRDGAIQARCEGNLEPLQ